MEYQNFSDKYYIRLDKGDELVASLLSLCEKEKIELGQISGIGGCDYVSVGIFNPETKAYIEHEVSAMLEMISLDGNISVYEDHPYLHAHAAFAYHDAGGAPHTLSGHLLKARIGLTGEIVLTAAKGTVSRRYAEDLGIRIWDFSENKQA